MLGIYMEVGLSVFEFSLRDGLNKRIDMFVADLKQDYKRGKECRTMTKQQWVEEFKRWSEQKELQQLAEGFILSFDGKENT